MKMTKFNYVCIIFCHQEEIKFQESVVSSATRTHFEGMKAVANRSWFNLITTVPQKKETFKQIMEHLSPQYIYLSSNRESS